MNAKPIKRSKELVQLSRDHHNGLLLCWKIRTGIKKDIDNKRIAQYALYFFNKDLKEHFRQEEKILFSLLPDSDGLKQDALEQHKFLYSLIAKIGNQQQQDTICLQELADVLEAHIRFEERQLFPYIEQTIDPGILKAAGEKIDAAHHLTSLEWNDEFWTKNN